LETVYEFNVGAALARGCLQYWVSREPVSAVERLLFPGNSYQQCAVIGRHQLTDVQLINPKDPKTGVLVTYTGGRLCSSREEPYINAKKQISMSIYCSTDQETDFRLSESRNEASVLQCHTYVEIKSPAGCPAGYIAAPVSSKTALLFV